jgi:hypothetical protein
MHKVFIAIPVSLISFITIANEFHYENIPVGDQPSALAGAYTSIMKSSYGMHYNPASIQGIGNTLSGTINAYSYENSKYSDVFPKPTSVNWEDGEREVDYIDESLDRTSQTILPGFLGYTTTIGDFTVGAYLATTDISYEELDEYGTFNYKGSISIYTDDEDDDDLHIEHNEQGEVIENRDFSLDSEYKVTQFGFSSAYKLNEAIDIGITFSGIFKKKKEVTISEIQYFQFSSDTDYYFEDITQASTRLLDDEVLIEPKFGAIYHQDNYAIGLTISQKYSLSRDLQYSDKWTNGNKETSEFYFGDDEENEFDRRTARFDIDTKQDYPLAIEVGANVTFDNIMLTMDIHHYNKVDSPVEFSSASEYGSVIDITRSFESVTNISAAIEVAISNKTKIAFGLYTDNSNISLDAFNEQRADGVVLFRPQEDVDFIGVTFSVNHKASNYNITTGLVVNVGDGYGTNSQLDNFGGGEIDEINSATQFKIKKQVLSLYFGVQY